MIERISIDEEYNKREKMFRQDMNSNIDKARKMRFKKCENIKTGFKSIDEKIGGFRSGELVLLASQHCFGTQEFAFDILIHNAINLKRTCLYISLYEREYAVINGLAGHMCEAYIREGFYSGGFKSALQENYREIKEAPLYIKHYDLDDIDKSLNLINEMDYDIDGIPKLIIVDRVTTWMNDDEVSVVIKKLNKLAYITNACILVLSNVTDEVEDRKDHQPLSSDTLISKYMFDYLVLMYVKDFYDDNFAFKDNHKIQLMINDHNLRKSIVDTFGYVYGSSRFIGKRLKGSMASLI